MYELRSYIAGCAFGESLKSDLVVAQMHNSAENHGGSSVADLDDGVAVLCDLGRESLLRNR